MTAKLLKTVAAIVFSASALFAADQFSGEKGDVWTGGSLNFISLSESGSSSSMNVFMISPMTRFFPATGFCIGPKVSFTNLSQSSHSQTTFGLGLETGYAHGTGTIPYFITSPHFAFVSYSGSSSSGQAFFLPFSVGLILPASKGLGMQLEAGYSIGFNMGSGPNTTLNVFTIGIGICGLGQKVAVSVVNVFNLLTSAF